MNRNSALMLASIALEPNRWRNDASPRHRLNDLLAGVARHHFTKLEIWQGHISTASANEVAQIRAESERLGISFPVLGLYPVIRLPGREGTAHLKEMIRLATLGRDLGVQMVKIFVGDRSEKDLDAEERVRSVAFLRQFVDEVQALGLAVAGESHANTMFDSVDACLATVSAVGQALKVCFQPYDFERTGATLQDFRALSKHIIHIHLQGRKHGDFSPLTEADIDYDVLIKELSDVRYSGGLCIEFVTGCVVDDPATFDVEAVLRAAARDADHILNLAKRHGLPIER